MTFPASPFPALSAFVAPTPVLPGAWVGRAVSSRRPSSLHCVVAPAGRDRGPASGGTSSSMPDFPSRPRPTRGGVGGRGDPRGDPSERRGPGGRYGDRDSRGPRSPRAPRKPLPPGTRTYTECGKCSAVYEISPEDLGEGRKVQCSVCDNAWFQRPDSLRVLREGSSFTDYPLEKKNELMAERAERAERFGNRRGGPGQGDGGRGREGGGGRWREGGSPGAQGGGFRGAGGRARFDGERGNGAGAGGGGPRRAGNGQHSVFIGNIPFSITSGELETLLQSAGGVERVSLVTDPNGRSKGFAFADMKSADDVSHCVETLNGYEMDGRQLTVRVGRKKQY